MLPCGASLLVKARNCTGNSELRTQPRPTLALRFEQRLGHTEPRSIYHQRLASRCRCCSLCIVFCSLPPHKYLPSRIFASAQFLLAAPRRLEVCSDHVVLTPPPRRISAREQPFRRSDCTATPLRFPSQSLFSNLLDRAQSLLIHRFSSGTESLYPALPLVIRLCCRRNLQSYRTPLDKLRKGPRRSVLLNEVPG